MNEQELSLKMLEDHEKAIHENILPRLQQVEEAQAAFNNQIIQLQTTIGKVQSGQATLELTVMKDGQATRDLLNKFVDHFFNQGTAAAGANERITLARLTGRQKIIIALLGTLGGGGGLIAGILAIINLFK